MIISIRDIFKMTGMLIVSFCAIIVCSMFLNYYLDLITVENLILTETTRVFYRVQCNNAKLVVGVSGGCLFLTTVVLLCFYIGHYIETHQKQLGIMKALGYTRFSVAKSFWVFGIPIFTGTGLGYLGAHMLMPKLYELQNQDGYLPEVTISFHPQLCLALVLAPTVFFSLSAIGYSFLKLKIPALWLMREQSVSPVVPAGRDTDMPFLHELQKSNARQKKSLLFFITFAVFCFAAMTQMSCSMDELASQMMAILTMAIGIVLATVTLLIATTSVIQANQKTIIMMKVFGYTAGECGKAVFSGYRPYAYLGFVLGTIYQYILLKFAVTVLFRDMADIPEYSFDVPVMLITFAAFIVLYEAIMFAYTKKIERYSVKEIMLD